ncbi:MAG: dTDP-4-dehydrorhamnose 3,5-epimerase [Kofleriaceae bacterium]|nr:dTDP-4-dehydrorhamnose 3,5-epimerase [Kofleriaceae bacterium]
MNVRETALPGVVVIQPKVFTDARGWFVETFRRDRYATAGIEAELVQHNRSRSVHGVLRGLHYQRRQPQGKLLEVCSGEIFDVVVDLRRGSPTFTQWFGIRMTATEHTQLWIPPGFAHGFLVLSEVAEISYGCTAYYDPDDACAIRWDDPELAIAWPLVAPPLLSPADREAPFLRDALLPEGTP